MNKVKGSMTPFAIVHMLKVTMNFPSLIREWVLNDFSKRVTFLFNGVSIKTLSESFSLFTHCKRVKICVTADKSVIKHPQLLMDIIYETYIRYWGIIGDISNSEKQTNSLLLFIAITKLFKLF
jgi:hypothetical protein